MKNLFDELWFLKLCIFQSNNNNISDSLDTLQINLIRRLVMLQNGIVTLLIPEKRGKFWIYIQYPVSFILDFRRYKESCVFWFYKGLNGLYVFVWVENWTYWFAFSFFIEKIHEGNETNASNIDREKLVVHKLLVVSNNYEKYFCGINSIIQLWCRKV